MHAQGRESAITAKNNTSCMKDERVILCTIARTSLYTYILIYLSPPPVTILDYFRRYYD